RPLAARRSRGAAQGGSFRTPPAGSGAKLFEITAAPVTFTPSRQRIIPTPFLGNVKSRRYRTLSLSRKRVLVADADEIVLALILHILQRQGYDVDVTTQAEEFSEKLRAGQYQAVLVDPNISPKGVKWIKSILT